MFYGFDTLMISPDCFDTFIFFVQCNMIRIQLDWKPKSTNHIYAVRVVRNPKWWNMPIMYLKKEGVALRKSYISQMKDQMKRPPILWDIKLRIEIYRFWAEPDRDNVHKLSMDAWNKVLRDDDIQIKDVEVVKVWKDNKCPRIVLFIQQIWNHTQ